MGPVHEILGRRAFWTILGVMIIIVAVISLIVFLTHPQSATPLPTAAPSG